MKIASVRLIFTAQSGLLAMAQIILLCGVLTFPSHSLLEPLANLSAAIGYAVTGAGFWVLVTRVPMELIRRLRPAFLLFGIGDVFATAALLAFLDFDAGNNDPGYTIAAGIVSVLAGLMIAIAWFSWTSESTPDATVSA